MLLKSLVLMGLACAAMSSPIMEVHHEETNSGTQQFKPSGRIFLTPHLYILESDISKYLQTEGLDLETADHESTHGIKESLRVRRSPQTSARVDVHAPSWTSANGRHNVQGGAYYQRNWNTPGPRQDYGGNVQYTYRIPG